VRIDVFSYNKGKEIFSKYFTFSPFTTPTKSYLWKSHATEKKNQIILLGGELDHRQHAAFHSYW